MKTKLLLLVPVALGLIGSAPASAESLAPPDGGSPFHGDPFTPAGSVQVTPAVVREGIQPDMTWAIEYPKSIPDVTVIIPPGKLVTINPKPDKICVRLAGVSFTSEDTTLPVALWIRTGGDGNPWELLFYGDDSDVNPSEILYETTVTNGTQVDFAARGRAPSGAWLETTWTLEDTTRVAAVANGEALPDEAFPNRYPESFMSHFVNDSRHAVLGPRDILYLFELGTDTAGSGSFDMQDIVAVVTWCKNNNGHGNNLDGVDVSNPGGGTGGPVGAVDPSGWIDDEARKIKRKS